MKTPYSPGLKRMFFFKKHVFKEKVVEAVNFWVFAFGTGTKPVIKSWIVCNNRLLLRGFTMNGGCPYLKLRRYGGIKPDQADPIMIF